MAAKVAPRSNPSACLQWNLVFLSLSLALLPLSWRLQAHPLCSWISLHVRSVNPPRRDVTIFTAAGAVRSTMCGHTATHGSFPDNIDSPNNAIKVMPATTNTAHDAYLKYLKSPIWTVVQFQDVTIASFNNCPYSDCRENNYCMESVWCSLAVWLL